MKILLHICCAPCAIYPVELIRKDAHKFAGYFYNPNIHPYPEYLKRKDEVEEYSKGSGFNVIYGDYEIKDYFQHIVYNEDHPSRCPVCWWLRLAKAARFAAKNGFDAFTTTLLGSPYQDHEAIKSISEDVAVKSGIKFYFKDFRIGFKAAHDIAREKGMYCQNYCGCIFSEKERIEARGRKKVPLRSVRI